MARTIVILMLLLGLALPVGCKGKSPIPTPREVVENVRRRRRMNRAMANLKNIGKALELYKETFHTGPPSLDLDTAYVNPEAEDPWQGLGENAMQNVWDMIKDDLVTEPEFTCPAGNPDEEVEADEEPEDLTYEQASGAPAP